MILRSSMFKLQSILFSCHVYTHFLNTKMHIKPCTNSCLTNPIPHAQTESSTSSSKLSSVNWKLTISSTSLSRNFPLYSICKSCHNRFVRSDISTLVTGHRCQSFAINCCSAILAARLELHNPSRRFADRRRCTASDLTERVEEDRAM